MENNIPNKNSLDSMEGGLNQNNIKKPKPLNEYGEYRKELEENLDDYKNWNFTGSEDDKSSFYRRLSTKIKPHLEAYRASVVAYLKKKNENYEFSKILDEMISLKTYIIPEELFIDYVLFIKEYIEGWHEIKPDIVFVTDSSALPISIAMKHAYKKMYPEEKIKFYRVSPLEIMNSAVPSTGIKDYSKGDTEIDDIFKWFAERKVQSTNNVEDAVKWLDNFSELLKLTPDIDKKKVVLYDENSPTSDVNSPKPHHVIHNGERYIEEENRYLKNGEERAKKILNDSGTLSHGVLILRKAGFKEIWVHSGSPNSGGHLNHLITDDEGNKRGSYFSVIKNTNFNILSGKLKGVKPKDKRKKAEEFLSELKLVAEYVVKLSEAEKKEVSNSEFKEIEYEI